MSVPMQHFSEKNLICCTERDTMYNIYATVVLRVLMTFVRDIEVNIIDVCDASPMLSRAHCMLLVGLNRMVEYYIILL